VLLSLDHFAPLVGTPFTLVDEATGRHAAALIEARPLNGPEFQGRRPFALLFEGPTQPVLPQRMYALEHPVFDALQIFLVPVARAASGMRYEAVFN
jgi:hypothetical protein